MDSNVEQAFVLILLLACSIEDLKCKKISNTIVFPGMIPGLFFSVREQCFGARIADMGILFLIIYLFFILFRNRIGMGDLKLWMMCCAFLGFRLAFLSFTAGEILLLASVLLKGKGRQVIEGIKDLLVWKTLPDGSERVCFAPFFFMGTLLILSLRNGGII